MHNKIPALVAAAFIIASVTQVSAAGSHHATTAQRHHQTSKHSAGVMLLENRPSVAPYVENPYTQDDKQSGHMW
jgi:hypothetical protein